MAAVGAVGVMVSLTGCASLMKSLGYEPIDSASAKACKEAQVLVTNLAASPNQRHYMLLNGQSCSNKVVVNEYATTQKSIKG